MDNLLIENMNWVDVEHYISLGYRNIVIGVGAVEQHGPHLPLKTDALIADYIVENVARKLGETLIAPTIRIGCSEHHLAFSGTISLRDETFRLVIKDYVNSLCKHGFKNIIFLPTHGGNFKPLEGIISKLQTKLNEVKLIAYTDLFGFVKAPFAIANEENVSEDEAGGHAGELETSMMLLLAPHLVKPNRYKPGYMGELGEEQVKTIIEEGMTALTETGVLGDPAKSNGKRGKKYLECIVDTMVDYILKELKGE